MTREEKVAWAAALRPGHSVSFGDRTRFVESTQPIWALGGRGTLIYTTCMSALVLLDNVFDTQIESRLNQKAYSALIKLGLRRIADIEVRLVGGPTCSAVHELLPVL